MENHYLKIALMLRKYFCHRYATFQSPGRIKSEMNVFRIAQLNQENAKTPSSTSNTGVFLEST